MTADLFVLGHAYLAIAASISVAVIAGTYLYARNEKRNRR